ncbi:hypothetical protein [Providencia hangzhouensis]
MLLVNDVVAQMKYGNTPLAEATMNTLNLVKDMEALEVLLQ